MRAAERMAEDGAAVILGLLLVGVIGVVATAVAVVGALVAGHRHAQNAADLAALAGAAAIQRGSDGCAAAEVNAMANGVRVESCVAAKGAVEVVVRTELQGVGAGITLGGRARAGPQ